VLEEEEEEEEEGLFKAEDAVAKHRATYLQSTSM